MQASTNFRGILFMCLAMVTFSCNDALVKSVTGAMNVGQIIFVRGLLTTLMVVLAAWQFRAFRPLGTLMKPVILLRIAMEALASVTYISASARSRSPMPRRSCRPYLWRSRSARPFSLASRSAGAAGRRSLPASSAC